MQELTSKERISRILHRQPVDRVGLFEHFWGDTQKKWASLGHIKEGEDLAEHFGYDLRSAGWLNQVVDLDMEWQTVEETEETIVVRDGNGALLRRFKTHDTTPEHVDFDVKDRATWEELARPKLLDDSNYPRRIDPQGFGALRQYCQEKDLYFCWAGVNVFELMHPVCGHEYMLMGMIEDPDWVKDMVTVYSDMIIALWEMLFSQAGKPDGIFFYEDMGFKGKPFMSPAMYKEIIWPAHKKTFDWAHTNGMDVIVHSCGYVEPLVPGLIEAGMDCLQAIEVKAGMDLPTLKDKFGDQIAFFGGMDIRTLESNNPAEVKAEIDAKLPAAMAGSGYILHTDHSVSDRVDYETYRYFVDYGLEVGTYK